MLKSKVIFPQTLSSWAAWKQTLRDLFVLTKPGVTIVLAFTAMTTAIAASGPWADPGVLFALLAAGLLTAGGAASLNQYLERDLDGQMPRTARRPLPSGRIENPRLALQWGLFLCALGLVVALRFMPLAAAALIFLGILVYVPVYTLLLKRRTLLNVVIGGLAGCCPVLAGWAAVRADWPLVPFALAAVVFFWTPAHFWCFAMAHVTDYQRAGFPMLPAIVGLRRSVPFIILHAYLAVMASLGAFDGLWLWATAAAGGLFLLACLHLWLRPNKRQAYYTYKISNYYLMIVFFLVVFTRL
jgi:protoheme IX farnesyltransferase